MTKVRELLDIPERVEKGQFQVTLTEGIARPKQTVDDYVITPRIADAFDRALGMIDVALHQERSVGVYLHGSFGSGKSHFMAMLSLLLADEELAWRRHEFDSLRAKYVWIGQCKVLELHMHMLGKDSLEAAIYPAYLAHLAQHHPDAPLPALFADKDLFENASELLDELGDQRFFARLNEASGGGGTRSSVTSADAWSFMGSAPTGGAWDRSRFETAVASQDLEIRQRLLDALLRTHFKAFRGNMSSYRELDSGLAILTEHAKQLAYGAVVLFLDELILRLSYGAAEPRWLSDMVQSMVKLVEREAGVLALPLVSFIARQRLLNEMVGDRLAGPDIALLNEQLDHSRGRFDKIELPNEELPEIISQRVLKPVSPAAKLDIDRAFEALQRSALEGRGQAAWQTLTAVRYDAAQFRKLYPFSPPWSRRSSTCRARCSASARPSSCSRSCSSSTSTTSSSVSWSASGTCSICSRSATSRPTASCASCSSGPSGSTAASCCQRSKPSTHQHRRALPTSALGSPAAAGLLGLRRETVPQRQPHGQDHVGRGPGSRRSARTPDRFAPARAQPRQDQVALAGPGGQEGLGDDPQVGEHHRGDPHLRKRRPGAGRRAVGRRAQADHGQGRG